LASFGPVRVPPQPWWILAVQISSLVSRGDPGIDRRAFTLLASRSFEVAHQDELAHLLSRDRELALAVPAVSSLEVDALGQRPLTKAHYQSV
jgi:hypothetical protein